MIKMYMELGEDGHVEAHYDGERVSIRVNDTPVLGMNLFEFHGFVSLLSGMANATEGDIEEALREESRAATTRVMGNALGAMMGVSGPNAPFAAAGFASALGAIEQAQRAEEPCCSVEEKAKYAACRLNFKFSPGTEVRLETLKSQGALIPPVVLAEARWRAFARRYR